MQIDGDTKWKNVIKYKNDTIWDRRNLLLLREGERERKREFEIKRERQRERMNYAIKMKEKKVNCSLKFEQYEICKSLNFVASKK